MKRDLAIGAALAGAVALGATIVAFGNAQQDADRPSGGVFAEKQESEIRAIVREFIVENPEVIIEALQAYDSRQRDVAEATLISGARANLSALLSDGDGFAAGAAPASATVAVIELFDYHCGYCKRAMGMVKDLTKGDPAVKVVFRELPILREESEYAARAALAARAQGKYAELHFAMMGASGVLDEKRVKEVAGKAGLDVAALERAMADPSIDKALADTRRIADAMGVEGTPAFIIASLDGDFIKVIPGFSEEHVRAAIQEAKESGAGKAGVASGQR